MPLPPPEQISKLLDLVQKHKAADNATFGEFSAVQDTLKKIVKQIGVAGVQSALQSGVNAAVGAAQVTVQVGAASVALFPIGAALGPWLAAAAIVQKSSGIFALHDLHSHASGKANSKYRCGCNKCAEGLQYVINKKENNVAIMAVSVFTAGLPLIFDKINSIRKSLQSNRPKEMYSRQFVQSAREGCISAMTTILLMCGDWPSDEAPDPELLVEAVAIILADDGWARLKSKW